MFRGFGDLVGGLGCVSSLTAVRLNDHYSTRKRCAVFRVSKLQSSAHKAHLVLYYILMPPLGISACRYQADNGCPRFCGLVSFTHPCADFTTIRWIHPAHAMPLLLESILCWREVVRALGVFWDGADIQLKSKLGIELVEKVLRRGVQVSCTREVDIHIAVLKKKIPQRWRSDVDRVCAHVFSAPSVALRASLVDLQSPVCQSFKPVNYSLPLGNLEYLFVM